MLNKIMLIGNLGKDPDFSVIPSTGNSVAKFTIAVNRNTKKGDDWVKETEWFNIVAFSTLGNAVRNISTRAPKCTSRVASRSASIRTAREKSAPSLR